MIFQFEGMLEKYRPQLELVVQWLQSPSTARLISVHECKTLMHPVYAELFDTQFTIDNIKDNWNEIQNKLFLRFPDELDTDFRKDRYDQILKCQSIDAYTPVCRAIYAEIESLLRDELLLGNPSWKNKWKTKADGNKRRSFQAKEFSELIKNEHPDFKLLDDNSSTSETGFYTLIIVKFIIEAFEKFDPANVNGEDVKSYRHIHAHGWAKKLPSLMA